MQVSIKADAFVESEALTKTQANAASASSPAASSSADAPGLTVEQLEEVLEERAGVDRRVKATPLPSGFTDRRKAQRRQSN